MVLSYIINSVLRSCSLAVTLAAMKTIDCAVAHCCCLVNMVSPKMVYVEEKNITVYFFRFGKKEKEKKEWPVFYSLQKTNRVVSFCLHKQSQIQEA